MTRILKLLTALMLLPGAVIYAQESELPKSVDNSLLMYFPPVINQQGGSCAQASGIGYMFTYEINRLLGRDAKASSDNRFAYLFTWNFVNEGGDNGGFVDEGLGIAKNFGVMTERDFTYAYVYQYRWASGFEKYHNAARYRVKRINKFDCTTDDELTIIKRYLYDHGDGSSTGGLVTFSTESSDWKINNSYEGPSLTGYKSMLTALATQGAHALTIAGYDDTVEYVDNDGQIHLGAFIVVNTWGTWWADNGRFYLPYYFFTHRKGFWDQTLSTTMQGCDVYVHEPKIMFKLQLDYTSRNDLRLTYGAATVPYALSPQNWYNSIILYNQGGDHPMRGSVSSDDASQLEVGIDYSDHIADNEAVYGKYFFNVVRGSYGTKLGEGTIDYLSVIDYRSDQPVEYVCRGIAGTPLKTGSNQFVISGLYPGHFSASPVAVKVSATGQPDPTTTYIVRTANGRFAKMQLTGNAENMQMKYTILKK